MKKAISMLAALAMTASALCAVSAEALHVTMRNHGMAGDEYYVEYCKDYLDKYDLTGDGYITAYDFNEAERRQEEKGEAYTGVRSSELAVFMINAEVLGTQIKTGDFNRDGTLNSLDIACAVKYAEACVRDGVEFPGYIGREWDKKFGGCVNGWYVTDEVGDLNGDGEYNARDVSALMKMILNGGPQNFLEEYKADVSLDGKVNAKDVTALIRMIMGEDHPRWPHECAAHAD